MYTLYYNTFDKYSYCSPRVTESDFLLKAFTTRTQNNISQ